jgi:hypothetical protein
MQSVYGRSLERGLVLETGDSADVKILEILSETLNDLEASFCH